MAPRPVKHAEAIDSTPGPCPGFQQEELGNDKQLITRKKPASRCVHNTKITKQKNTILMGSLIERKFIFLIPIHELLYFFRSFEVLNNFHPE